MVRRTFTELRDSMIGTSLEGIVSIKKEIERKNNWKTTLSLADRKQILSELKSLNDIFHIDECLYVNFDEVYAYLDMNDTALGDQLRMPKALIYNMWKIGLIKFKLSKSTVKLKMESSRHGENFSLNISTTYEDPRRKNPHDNGLNCWGGWSGSVLNLFQRGDLVTGLQNIAHRMKQFNLNDGASSYVKLVNFDYEKNQEITLNAQETEAFKQSLAFLYLFNVNRVTERLSLSDSNIRTGMNTFNSSVSTSENDQMKVLRVDFQGDRYIVKMPLIAYNNHVHPLTLSFSGIR